jgi:hypothetical protein
VPRAAAPVRKVVVAAGALIAAAALTGCPSQGGTPSVQSVTISSGDRWLAAGESLHLTAIVSPAGASDAVIWTSQDPGVAAVTGTGASATVTAVAPGTTAVSAASASDPTRSSAIEVTVIDPGTVLWTRQFGTLAYDDASAVATDADGRVVVVGATVGSLGGLSEGGLDVHLIVFGSIGQPIWGEQFGSASADYVEATATDGANNIVIGGATAGDVEGVNAGGLDALVRKYGPTSVHRWTRQFGSDTNDSVAGVGADAAGNVYAVGRTMGDLAGTNAGDFDAFVRKLSPEGDHLWTRQLGTDLNDFVRDGAVSVDGSVFIAGSTGGAWGGPNLGEIDALVVKLDSTGAPVWTRQFGTPGSDAVYGVAIGAGGEVILVGGTTGDLAAAGSGASDAFVRAYDADGNHSWTVQFGTTGTDIARAVALDASGNVFVAGTTQGSLVGSHAGLVDVFVMKLTGDGDELWARQFGTGSDDYAMEIATDSLGRAFVVGYTEGAIVADNAGEADGFIRAYGP